jgi:hypothetical protein
MNFMLTRQALACAVLLAAGPIAASAAGKLDTTPPVLKSFQVTPPADMADPLAQIRIDAKVTDDMSGVGTVAFGLLGPHGQYGYAAASIGLPEKTFAGHMVVFNTQYLEPGTWTIQYVNVQDMAGNAAWISDPATIAAAGALQFTVTSSRPQLGDYTPPVVLSANVVTPSVSASATLKGTTLPAYFAVDVTLRDDKSGIGAVWANWCLADFSACIFSNATEGVYGHVKSTLRMGGSAGVAPGVYVLYSLGYTDQASNAATLIGTDFGGETDFSTLMPGGHTITITP